jgi:anaphase-promoting complex subunit 8
VEEEEDMIDEDEFQLAKGYFDVKEFDRVVHVLRDAPGKRARFLRIYSAYLVS